METRLYSTFFFATNMQTVSESSLYADLPGYRSLSIVTGDTYRPHLLPSKSTGVLYIVELTVGFESNLHKNVERKKLKYKEFIREQNEHFKTVKFVNLSISSLSLFAKEGSSFTEMLNGHHYCIRKVTTIAIRTTYNVIFFVVEIKKDESRTVNCLNIALSLCPRSYVYI